MISRYSETEDFGNQPRLELAPDGYRFNSFDGRVRIHLVELDLDTGKFNLRPDINCDVSLGRLSAKASADWAEVLKVASMIVNRENLGLLDEPVISDVNKLWNRADKLINGK